MAYKIHLSTDEAYELADRMQGIDNKKLSRRLLAISLRHYGYPVKQIALLTGVSAKTVTGWFRMFVNGGFDELLKLEYPKNRGSMLEAHQEAIRGFWEERSGATLEELQTWLKEERNIEVEYSWLYRYLDLHHLLPGSDGNSEV